MTKLHEVQNEIARQLKESKWFGEDAKKDLIHSILGIAEEAGELAGLCKRTEFRHKFREEEEWMSEFGDVLWYLVAAISVKGMTLDDVWEYNCNKLADRRTTGLKGKESWEG